MDFVLKLSFTLKKHESIILIVECFSKMTHFIPYTNVMDASWVTKLYFDEIMKLYHLSKAIVLDRDVRCMNYFWNYQVEIIWYLSP
jgi:hypothetical protein